MSGLQDSDLDAFADWERAAWETRAAAYAEGVGRLTRGGVAALLDAAGVGKGTRLLDVATGPGFVAEAAAARGADVTAVDQSQAMVAIARERLSGVEVRQAPAERLGLPDASYDAVVAGFLLNHLARPEAGVAELVRVLRPGGRLALSVWDRPAANRVNGLIGEVVAAQGLQVSLPPGPDSAQFADDALFERLLAGAGLDEVRVERLSWTVECDPGEWFDIVASAMPRSGAVVAALDESARRVVREAFVRRALADHGGSGGVARFPAVAVVGSGRRPAV